MPETLIERLARERDEARAEVERLRDLIGETYAARGESVIKLRGRIRRLFFDSHPRSASTAKGQP